MPRVGLTPRRIARAAAELVDRQGAESLSLAEVANALGVRPPSLYNHVGGLGALQRLVALDGLDQLADLCRAAVMGRAGEDALGALARAYRAFAVAHPGVYALTQISRPGDPDYERRAQRVLEPVLALLAGFGLPEGELIHAARAVRSGLHGFATLETRGGFGLDVDLDESFAWMVTSLQRALRS